MKTVYSICDLFAFVDLFAIMFYDMGRGILSLVDGFV